MITADELIKLVDADRQARGMNHTDYSAYLGISKTYWTRLRNGERKPTINVLKILKEKIPTLKPQIDAYIASLTETNGHISPDRALRGQKNGIDRGGDT